MSNLKESFKKLSPFKKITASTFTICGIVNILFITNINDRIESPLKYLFLLVTIIIIPLLWSITIYAINKLIRSKDVKLINIAKILISFSISIYVTYYFVSYLFLTSEVTISSPDQISEISFKLQSSHFPLQHVRIEKSYKLELLKPDQRNDNRFFRFHKVSGSDKPIVLPWGYYDYIYKIKKSGGIKVGKERYYFKSFKDTLAIPGF